MFYLFRYDEGESLDRDETGNQVVTYANVDLLPLTVSSNYPMHGVVTPLSLLSLYIFSSGLDDLEIGQNRENFQTLNRFSSRGQVKGFETEPNIIVGRYFPVGYDTVSFRQRVGTDGYFGGVSLEIRRDEISA